MNSMTELKKNDFNNQASVHDDESGKLQTLAASNSKAYRDFKVISKSEVRGNNILLYAKDRSFLIEKLEAISNYTKKSDPFFKQSGYQIVELSKEEIQKNRERLEDIFLKERSAFKKILEKKGSQIEELSKEKIQECLENHEDSIEGFTYYASLSGILPRFVKVLYGNHSYIQDNSNCHGVALFAGGVFPVPMDVQDEPRWVDENILNSNFKTNKVAVDQILCGDLVTITRNFEKNKGDHSFIFIDHDISLSKENSGLAIVGTSKILSDYGYFEDFLIRAEQSCAESFDKKEPIVSIRRKYEEWVIPENIISCLMEYYEMYKGGMYSTNESFGKLMSIAMELKKQADLQNGNDVEQSAWKLAYEEILATMPREIQKAIIPGGECGGSM